MSIFSSLRRSRQSAKDHNAKLAEQKRKEAEKIPYRHVPTHAATDAVAGAPSAMRESDKSRIIEANRRRSAMAASGHHMNMPSIPRVGSSLSYVSYPSDNAPQTARLPRAYSYNGVSPYSPYSMGHGRDGTYSAMDVTEAQRVSHKGKEVGRSYGSDSLRISPSSSKGEPSPAESSGESTTSQDDLEMRSSRPSARPTSSGERTHRLHPSNSRRLSDASIEKRRAVTNSAKANGQAPTIIHHHTTSSRESRPPPSTRGFSSIPANIGPSPIPSNALPGALPARTSTEVPGRNGQPLSAATSQQSSTASLPGLSTTSTRPALSGPTTPSAIFLGQTEFPLRGTSPSASDAELSVGVRNASEVVNNAAVMPVGIYRDRRASKLGRFNELTRIDSQAELPHHSMPRMDSSQAPPPVSHEQIVNVFPEQAALPEAEQPVKKKGKRLSKTGGKLVKKNRMSMS